ncbi:hypothetical protein KCG43_11290 [Photobacterium sp. WH24]|uniref:hypothetical protein n=1 Tax=Photobacterium sp. WH24 TaxID=2827237 RepID=UPI001C475A56|nr:hypothetical protein [Photobacterium sp. WH24]MBV7262580.1 hypothetical protein [Photobacterium sp. WH24]
MSFIAQYPELKNKRWKSIFMEGRATRIKAELAQAMPSQLPLFSHDATYQSLFEKGWRSVTPVDVEYQRQKRNRQLNARIQEIKGDA